MKYQLIENYFQTALFQEGVQHYFDTVLGKVIEQHTLLDAKGKFIKDGRLWKDYYDMPYHTHILIGLIPSLAIYEKFLQESSWIDSAESEIYLKVFILGYTFHDSNKLFDTDTLEQAIEGLEQRIYQYDVLSFFPEFEQYKDNVYFLNLSDEDRTSVLANKYKITLDSKHIKEDLGLLCKFADGLASSQKLDNVAELYKDTARCVKLLAAQSANLAKTLTVSYVQIRDNPYILLSQNMLRATRKVLYANDKQVLFATRNGFVFFGNDLDQEEYAQTLKVIQNRGGDIKHLELTKVDAQKCTFDFIGTKEFNQEILDDITDELKDKFLALSPNGLDKFIDFSLFVQFNEKLIAALDLPIKTKVKDDKLYLFFDENIEQASKEYFVKCYCLNKIKWLNAKKNKVWKRDLDYWINEKIALPNSFELDNIVFTTNLDIVNFIKTNTKSSNALLKTYLNFIKSTLPLLEKDEEELEELVEELSNEILDNFNSAISENSIIKDFFERYFTFRGETALDFINSYNPIIPKKAEMCAFTGGIGQLDYKEGVAFGMKARGFSNRTVTALKNNNSHVSELFAEENKLRKSNKAFPNDSNIVIYIDFFEAQLDINRDILAAAVKAKNLKWLEKDDFIEFDKSAKFQYNFYSLEFAKLKTSVEENFFFVRKMLLLIKALGLRVYVTGIMSPYHAHKEAFRFENAPRFVHQLGWNSIRLIEVEQVLAEIKLVILLGRKRIDSNLLKISESRQAYFKIYNELSKEEKRKVYDDLDNFISNNPDKFNESMTIIQKLVDIAVQLEDKSDSGAKETWLIRTALDFIRKNAKEGVEKEDTIQQISGEIYRKLKQENPDLVVIESFAQAVYEELFEGQWNGKILNLNREKEWIYQFAFVFKKTHQQRIDLNTANKIEREMKENKIPISLENIAKHIGRKRAKYANKYYQLIQK